MYRREISWAKALKMVVRAGSNCSNSYERNVCMNVMYKSKTFSSKKKVKISYDSKCDRLYLMKHYGSSNWVRSLSKPVSPSLDDIQIKWSGSVACQDQNSIVTRIDVRSLLPYFSYKIHYEAYCKDGSTCSPLVQHLLCSDSQALRAKRNSSNTNSGKASNEQLEKIYNILGAELPTIFVKTLNYSVYSPSIIFENRISGRRTVGLTSYIRQVAWFRIVAHWKYAFVKFEILNITKHSEDSTVRVRWRILGLSTLESISFAWRAKSYKLTESKDMSQWHDGFSLFYIGSDGLIHRHVADKMMPDEEVGVVKKLSFATRLAMLLGLAPKAIDVPQSVMSGVHIDKGKQKVLSDCSGFVSTEEDPFVHGICC